MAKTQKSTTTSKAQRGAKQTGARSKAKADVRQAAEGAVAVAEPEAAKAETGKKPRRKKSAERPAGKLSQLDAAAQVLAGTKTPMTTKEMVEAMASQALWTSPGGKTPHATLYSAILREINAKGKEARFVKTERGKFTTNG